MSEIGRFFRLLTWEWLVLPHLSPEERRKDGAGGLFEKVGLVTSSRKD
jgi:hypothetical protein